MVSMLFPHFHGFHVFPLPQIALGKLKTNLPAGVSV